MDHLRAVSLFLSAAELGSFNRAAVLQGLTPQAVSKSIGLLEHHLGVRLFHRTTRKFSLTDEGQWLLERVRPDFNGLLESLDEVKQQAAEGAGKLRVAAAGAVARNVIVPLIPRFIAEHPGIVIEIVVDDLITDTVAQRIDVGFRAGREPSTQVVSRRLFSFQHVICAAPEYLHQHGPPSVWADLANHRCTGFRQPISGQEVAWESTDDGEIVGTRVEAVFWASETETELVAVLAGMGIGQIDTINAAAHVRAGRLVPLLTEHISDSAAVYLYYPRRERVPKRVRLFIDFMVQALGNTNAFRLSPADITAVHARDTAR